MGETTVRRTVSSSIYRSCVTEAEQLEGRSSGFREQNRFRAPCSAECCYWRPVVIRQDRRPSCSPASTTVFAAGEGGYAGFLNPSLVRLSTGQLLVFSEARRGSAAMGLPLMSASKGAPMAVRAGHLYAQ